jgi:hypothetical protein
MKRFLKKALYASDGDWLVFGMKAILISFALGYLVVVCYFIYQMEQGTQQQIICNST